MTSPNIPLPPYFDPEVPSITLPAFAGTYEQAQALFDASPLASPLDYSKQVVIYAADSRSTSNIFLTSLFLFIITKTRIHTITVYGSSQFIKTACNLFAVDFNCKISEDEQGTLTLQIKPQQPSIEPQSETKVQWEAQERSNDGGWHTVASTTYPLYVQGMLKQARNRFNTMWETGESKPVKIRLLRRDTAATVLENEDVFSDYDSTFIPHFLLERVIEVLNRPHNEDYKALSDELNTYL